MIKTTVLPAEFEEAMARELKNHRPRTDAEIIAITERVLLDLNIDHMHWEEVQEIRKDFAWLRDQRRRCESVTMRGIITVVSLIIAGVMGILAIGVKEWIEHG